MGNNPVNLIDPTGHAAATTTDGGCVDTTAGDCLDTFRLILQIQQMNVDQLMQMRVMGCGLTSSDTDSGSICSALGERAIALGNSDLADWFVTDDGGIPFELPHPGELSAFSQALNTPIEIGSARQAFQRLMDDETGGIGGTSWSAARRMYWRQAVRQEGAADKYGQENLARMKLGLAPQRRNPITGEMESMELHHIDPQRNGGSNDPGNLMEVWPDEHAAIDPYRRTGR